MGVSALLDVLLAEGHAGKEAPPSSPVLEVERNPGSPDELAYCQVSPRSRQIAELCGEMDTCLASLGRWEEESRRRVELLRQDLEQQYGFSYEERGAVGLQDWELKDIDEPDDLQQEALAGEVYCQALSPSIVRSSSNSPPRLTPLQAAEGVLLRREDLLRHADEERIARLRAEVESLRCKEVEMQQEIMQQWLDCENMDPSASGPSELSALCREADRVLGEGSLFNSRTEMLLPQVPGGASEIDGVDDMEARLAEAQKGLAQMEGAMHSSRSQIDSELAELEQLLADRETQPCAGVARLGRIHASSLDSPTGVL